MAKAGWYLKQYRAAMNAAAAPCPGCGHPMGDHRELMPTIALVDGAIVETPHPEYEPLVFHCDVNGCDCTIDRRDGK